MRIDRSNEVSEDSRTRILDALSAHADEAGHPFRADKILFEAWEGDTWLGGLVARLGREWVFVELLATAAAVRGQGVGRKLMQELEAEARAHGMAGIWLDTFAFQAPGFYHRLGFSEFGVIENYVGDQARHFLLKRLG